MPLNGSYSRAIISSWLSSFYWKHPSKYFQQINTLRFLLVTISCTFSCLPWHSIMRTHNECVITSVLRSYLLVFSLDGSVPFLWFVHTLFYVLTRRLIALSVCTTVGPYVLKYRPTAHFNFNKKTSLRGTERTENREPTREHFSSLIVFLLILLFLSNARKVNERGNEERQI